jgi:hypothetical protein
MEKQVTKNRKEQENSVKFDQVIERGCGMDVHQDTVVVRPEPGYKQRHAQGKLLWSWW